MLKMNIEDFLNGESIVDINANYYPDIADIANCFRILAISG